MHADAQRPGGGIQLRLPRRRARPAVSPVAGVASRQSVATRMWRRAGRARRGVSLASSSRALRQAGTSRQPARGHDPDGIHSSLHPTPAGCRSSQAIERRCRSDIRLPRRVMTGTNRPCCRFPAGLGALLRDPAAIHTLLLGEWEGASSPRGDRRLRHAFEAGEAAAAGFGQQQQHHDHQ